MKSNIQHIFDQLKPFFFWGILLSLLIGIVIIFAYVLLGGLVIGALLWGVAVLRKMFRSKSSHPSPPPSSGRIIEHEKK